MLKVVFVAAVFSLISAVDGYSLSALAETLCRRQPEKPYCAGINADRSAEASEVRRAPIDFGGLAALASGGASGKSPLAFGRSVGNNANFEVPGLGVLGVGESSSDIAKFIPVGVMDENPNGGTFKVGDSQFGFTQDQSGSGRTKERHSKISLAGIGTFDLGKKAENGAGIANFFDSLIPKIPDPPGGIENTTPTPFAETEAPQNAYYESEYSANAEKYKAIIRDYEKRVQKAKTSASKNTGTVKDDDSEEFDKDGFIEQKDGFDEDTDRLRPQLLTPEQVASGHAPLSALGLEKEQIHALCQKFSLIAADVCYGSKIEPQYIDKCQGYARDCAGFIAEAKPLGAIANAYQSNVGLTYYNWGVNGIPYYAVNEEGAVSNGHNGKVDFGTYGGGYSDTLNVRDFWGQTTESGANWYEGLYGYKTGWHVPIASQFGVEGGGGTHVYVPVKEGHGGRPIQVSNGYHVGPYYGMAESVGVDWMNGGVSASRGLSLPIVGVNANAGTSVGFPSVGTMLRAMGMGG
uniref:Peptidase S1 domain-containing protein n=1 Tax=Panagrellus redivivus TaxID=6233 RepID=A0A7E4V8I2_PANRE